jgi:hypothetical protein
MDRLVVVVTDEPTQIARLMARDGIDRDEALRKIRSQIPLAEKAKLADYVIDNSGDPGSTVEVATRVFQALVRESACSWQLIDHVTPLAVLFLKGVGIYKQRRVSPADIGEQLGRASPSIQVLAYHWRPSGNIVVRDAGRAALAAVAATAQATLGFAVVARSVPELQRIEWSWPADLRPSPGGTSGCDVPVVVMLSAAVPDAERITGRLGSRVEVVRWVSAQDVLCVYRRPPRNGSLGHVSTVVEAALRRQGVPTALDATTRSVGVVTELLDGTTLRHGGTR